MQLARALNAVLAVAVAARAVAAAPAGAEDVAISRVEPGRPFTPMKLTALAPGEKTPRPIDLAAFLGRRPVVFCYFAAGEPIGEEGLMSLQELALGELKGKVDFFGAAKVGGKVSGPEPAARASLPGVAFPIIVEEQFRLGAALGAAGAPSISLIDASGVLRIADARSLRQMVAPGLTLAGAIRAAAAGRPVPTVARLPRYDPAKELVGEPCPDFVLGKLKSAERVKLSDVIARNAKDNKVTVIMFWHPDCEQCRTEMPGIVTGYNSYHRWLDIVSVADLKNAGETSNAEDAIRAHNMAFPVLADEGGRVARLYKVVSIPTIFFVKPDGRIESVYCSGQANFLPIFAAKIRSILGLTGRTKAGGAPG